jgi:pimeloyl-ACP methyl ester carboxylesterase
MDLPQTKYLSIGGSQVAYQVVGTGPTDLLYFYGLGTQIDMMWIVSSYAEILQRLSTITRLITFDRRGVGASGALPSDLLPTWEQWAEDLGAVLDEAGSRETSLLAEVEVGPIAILFAALRPERVRSLILSNTSSRYLIADDYPIGVSPEAVPDLLELVEST